MHFLLETMKAHFPRLNRAPYCFEDVERIAKRQSINIRVCPHDNDILAYYCTKPSGRRRKKFIVLNEGLPEVTKTFVSLHELAHHFAHRPPNSWDWHFCRRSATLSDRKNDCEADAFALIAMVPLPLLFELSELSADELSPELAELCLRRKALFELYEI
jgi:IrrE N-terminal-like domain